MDYQQPCDVSEENPPGPQNPLPKFGELSRKRYEQRVNNPGTSYEARKAKKREMCRVEPLKPPCIPETVMLPVKPLPSTVGIFLEADVPQHNQFGTFLRSIRVGREDIYFPGWLIELTNPQLQSVVDAKDLLATGKPLCDLLDPLVLALEGLDSGITNPEVREILRRTPLTAKGWSFSHFMFIAGNPRYAKKKGVLQDPFLFEEKACVKEDEAGNGAGAGKKSQSKTKSKVKVIDRLYQLPKLTKDDWPPTDPNKKAAGDEAGYNLRQKLFYSGLLYCEMYDTMQDVEKLYLEGSNIPIPRERQLKREQQTGFGVSNIGTRKLGFAEWDRPLPPLPKTSPYVTDFALVGTRRQYVRPQGQAYMYRRSVTSYRPLFLAIKSPKKQQKNLRVNPDSARVKSILDYLASQGNCLALLPDVQSIFHLSDTLLKKMEDVRPRIWIKPERYYRGNENQWISAQAKNLFRPHGLPPQIAKIPQMIAFSDGLKLREICKQVRKQHWSYICVRKTQFRHSVWPLMHVEKIPCGNLRENFIYAFETLLPAKSYLPVIRSDPLPW